MLLRVIRSEADAAGRSIGRCRSIPRSCGRISTPPPNVLFGRIARSSKRRTGGSVEYNNSSCCRDEPGDHALGRSRRAEHEDPRRGRRPWPPAGHPAHPGPSRRCSDNAATARRPAGRATARATAHPARPCSGRQGLLLARDPHPPASPRDRQRDLRTRRPEGGWMQHVPSPTTKPVSVWLVSSYPRRDCRAESNGSTASMSGNRRKPRSRV